jgi:hypothetical protein
MPSCQVLNERMTVSHQMRASVETGARICYLRAREACMSFLS